jgi:hypothetical protein
MMSELIRIGGIQPLMKMLLDMAARRVDGHRQNARAEPQGREPWPKSRTSFGRSRSDRPTVTSSCCTATRRKARSPDHGPEGLSFTGRVFGGGLRAGILDGKVAAGDAS